MAEERTTCAIVSADDFPWRLWPHFYVVTNDPDNSVWSNFEIADMNFWRSEAYTKFFDHLDASGGFYYEVSVLISLPCC